MKSSGNYSNSAPNPVVARESHSAAQLSGHWRACYALLPCCWCGDLLVLGSCCALSEKVRFNPAFQWLNAVLSVASKDHGTESLLRHRTRQKRPAQEKGCGPIACDDTLSCRSHARCSFWPARASHAPRVRMQQTRCQRNSGYARKSGAVQRDSSVSLRPAFVGPHAALP
jgi:hypothetical protein